MLSDPFISSPNKARFRRCYSWYVLAVALIVFSMIAQQPLALLTAMFAVLIGLIPDIWYRRALRSLLVRQQTEPQHVLFGEEITFSLSIENQKLLPLPWLKIECPVYPPLTVQHQRMRKRERLTSFSEGWTLWSLQRLTRYHRMRCLARGCSLLGPLRLRSSDPFGWFEREATLPRATSLIVYPLVVPLEVFGLAWLRPLGQYVTPHHLLEDPLWLAGIREYQIGDDPRRIHWKATAHTGTLQSKLYEHTSSPRMLILLDTLNYAAQWMGADRELQELTITVAASLAIWALDEDAQVGLLANGTLKQWFMESAPLASRFQNDGRRALAAPGDIQSWQADAKKVSPPGISVPFSRHHNQYDAMLSTLACLDLAHHIPMAQLIDREDVFFRHGTAAILVSAASTLHVETVEHLLNLSRQGTTVHLVLINDARQKHVCETYNLPVSFVESDIWHQMLKAVEEENYESISTLQLQWDQRHHPSPV